MPEAVDAARGPYTCRVVRDARIPRADGSLSADLFLPEKTGPSPAIITLLPYRKDLTGGTWSRYLEWFATHGYACLLADLGGYGMSDGAPAPKMADAEGDDAVAAIEWTAAQDWCDGSVGMWGISSGGVVTLRAAARSPAPLKAVIPMLCPVDPGVDAFLHDGARVDLHQRVLWSGSLLLQQLLPPLLDDGEPRSTERWRDRLSAPPFFADFAAMRPGDSDLRTRAIDVNRIAVPAFCVGGWHDLYADSITRLYEQLNVPKKLLVGPWFHNGPFGSIAFLPLALRWWDHWLRSDSNDVMAEPAATVWMLGERPQWASYSHWPPKEAIPASWALGTGELRPGGGLEYRPDPTIGTCSGLWGIPNGGFGLPLDQHDDDLRSVTLSSKPLPRELLITGSPTLEVSFDPASAALPGRLVARLSTVGPDGRSVFVTAGVCCGCDDVCALPLRSTAYRVPAGHRLRVALCDSDFPRLVPLTTSSGFRIRDVRLTLPAGEVRTGAEPAPPAPAEGAGSNQGRWRISRDPLTDTVTVEIGETSPSFEVEQGHMVSIETSVEATVAKCCPDEAVTSGSHRARVVRRSGETIDVEVRVRCTQDELRATGLLTIDQEVVFDREWTYPLERESAWTDRTEGTS